MNRSVRPKKSTTTPYFSISVDESKVVSRKRSHRGEACEFYMLDPYSSNLITVPKTVGSSRTKVLSNTTNKSLGKSKSKPKNANIGRKCANSTSAKETKRKASKTKKKVISKTVKPDAFTTPAKVDKKISVKRMKQEVSDPERRVTRESTRLSTKKSIEAKRRSKTPVKTEVKRNSKVSKPVLKNAKTCRNRNSRQGKTEIKKENIRTAPKKVEKRRNEVFVPPIAKTRKIEIKPQVVEDVSQPKPIIEKRLPKIVTDASCSSSSTVKKPVTKIQSIKKEVIENPENDNEPTVSGENKNIDVKGSSEKNEELGKHRIPFKKNIKLEFFERPNINIKPEPATMDYEEFVQGPRCSLDISVPVENATFLTIFKELVGEDYLLMHEMAANLELFESFIHEQFVPAMENLSDFIQNPNTSVVNLRMGHYETERGNGCEIHFASIPKLVLFPIEIERRNANNSQVSRAGQVPMVNNASLNIHPLYRINYEQYSQAMQRSWNNLINMSRLPRNFAHNQMYRPNLI